MKAVLVSIIREKIESKREQNLREILESKIRDQNQGAKLENRIREQKRAELESKIREQY